jgi:hypothetical protein
MTDNIIRAWALAAEDDFGGSLDDVPPEPIRKPQNGGAAKSGIPYTYKHLRGYQTRIPGVKSRFFTADQLDQAREFVSFHLGGI